MVRQETQTNQLGQVISLAKRVSIHRSLPEPGGATDNGNSDAVGLAAVPLSPPGADVILPKPEPAVGSQRYFEDVAVGEPLPPVVKGPMTTTHLVRWAAANGNYARIHWDLPFAQSEQGLPNVVVNGSLKNQYLGQLLIEFAGEEGWFKRFYVQHRGMDFPGDVLTASGVVSDKREVGGYGLVDCTVELTNSRGHQTAAGQGTVVLPKRGQTLPLIWPEEPW